MFLLIVRFKTQCPSSNIFPWQVWKLRNLLALPQGPVAIHHDSWSIKKLFSLSLRRSGADSRNSFQESPNRRATCDQFFFPQKFLTFDRIVFKAFLLPTASIKADGVAAYYDVMFRHWEQQLKDLHAQRVARKEAAVDPTSSEILIIDDDDGDSNEILELEEKSLIEAQKGIITIVDGSGDATLDDILPAPEGPSAAAAESVDDRIAMLKE